MVLSIEAKTEIRWWIGEIRSQVRRIDHGKVMFTLTTDASQEGWGAVFDQLTGGVHRQCAGGRWNLVERLEHINVLELKAAFLGIKSFCHDIHAVHINIYMDNTTAVAYVNHMGGSHSPLCNEIALQIWDFCRQQDIWVSAAHLPRHLNVLADSKTRVFDDKTEWKLHADVFRAVVSKFVTPNIDLFASRLNYQLKPYVAWMPDPGSMFTDAFTLDWSRFVFYAFPPFSILARVLKKIEYDGARGILILPNWPTQVWFPLLRRLLLAEPMNLDWRKDLVTLPFAQGGHPLGHKLRLMACYLCGSRS